MAKQNNDQPDSGEAIAPHIAEMMGPTPEEATPQKNIPAHVTESLPEPSSAPIIPDSKLPKEIQAAKTAKKDTPEPAPLTKPETAEAETDSTDDVVDEIVREESDELLKKEDEEIASAFTKDDKPKGFFGKIKHALSSWWHNPKARNLTLAGMGVVLVGVMAFPTTRYAVLNTVGVRAGLSVVVLDESTQQPLKNVQLKVGDQTAQTDTEGRAKLTKLRLGANTLQIEKVAFAPISRQITVGWGSNPIGEVALTPTGAQYRFNVKDFLSDKPLPKTEATSGAASAVADENGEIVLTVDVDDEEAIEVTITNADYRTETRRIATSIKDAQTVKMAPSRQHVFVSKRSGRYDLFKIYADGKQEKLLLKATGTERDDMVVVPHPTKNLVAFVSTRDNKRNDDGYLMSGLMTIDVESGETTDVAMSERIQVIDWIGDRLVYVAVKSGQSANSPKRHRLMSYDANTAELQELAYSNYFNDVMIAKGTIYYAPSSNGQKNQVALHKVKPDGTNAENILNKEVWNLFRTDYDTLQFSQQQDWYEYVLGDAAATSLDGAPADPKNRLYRDAPDGSRSLWVDQRDGRGVLLSYDLTTKQDKTLKAQSGLRGPILWLNKNYVVYRISTDAETADYVMNLDGGEARKIQDVTNTGGIDRWYYYQ